MDTISPAARHLVAAKMRAAWGLWGTLTVAPLVYAVIGFVVAGRPSAQAVVFSPLAVQIVAGFALVDAALGWFLPGYLFVRTVHPLMDLPTDAALRKLALRDATRTEDDQQVFTPEQRAAVLKLPPFDQKTMVAFGPWFRTLIVQWALLEVPAVIGLALAFLLRDPYFHLPFSVGSVILLGLCRPDLNRLSRQVDGLTGKRTGPQ